MAEKQIPQEVLAVLSASTCEGNRLLLPRTLPRPLYAQTAKVLEALGGRWNRRAGAHLFADDAAEAMEQALLTGSYARTKQDFGQFDTPAALAEEVVKLADIQRGMMVLEPSAGKGNLIAAILKVTASGALVFGHEIDQKRHEACRMRHFNAFGAGGLALGDFLAREPNPVFERVVMNPPFAKRQDIAHVMHALRFLTPGGRLVAIMSAAVRFRMDAETRDFRHMVLGSPGCSMLPLPDGAFRESGTDVKTVAVVITNGGDHA